MIRRASTIALAAATLWTATAAAQVTGHASVGFSRYDQQFDGDRDRNDTDQVLTDVSIRLGADYNILLGLRAGLELSLAHQSLVNGVDKSRFDIRELILNVGFGHDLGVVAFDVGAGFKIDLAQRDGKLTSTTELPVSDGVHAFKAHAMVRAGLGPLFNLGARARVVVHIPREIEVEGVAGEVEVVRGLIVDPALTLGVGIGIVNVGLDVGVLYRGDAEIAGVETDSSGWLLHAIPKVSLNLFGQTLAFALGYHAEDYMVGIPLYGESFAASKVPPMELSWSGSF